MIFRQVAISLNKNYLDGFSRQWYGQHASFITLAISDWLKGLKLELGAFNRIVFEEAVGCDAGVKVLGDIVLVCLQKEFHSLEQLATAQACYDYFRRKYLEGFELFDAHFGLKLTPQLIAFLSDYFKDGYVYEKEMKSRRVHGLKYQVLKQYRFDAFNLVLRVWDKTGNMVRETILQTRDPDPIRVYYNVNKVNILEDRIEVLGSTHNVEAEYQLTLQQHF